VSASSIHPLPTGQCGPAPVAATVATAPDTAPPGAVPMCSWELDTEVGPAEPILILRVAGEIDLLTMSALERALDAALDAATDQRSGDLVVDLAGVGFCCVRGFALLFTAAATAQTNGTGYALSGLSPHLDRIATLLWPGQRCVRYRSTAAAVTAIRIHHTHQPARTRPAIRDDSEHCVPAARDSSHRRAPHRIRWLTMAGLICHCHPVDSPTCGCRELCHRRDQRHRGWPTATSPPLTRPT
jgi:anti-anti-sigma factor